VSCVPNGTATKAYNAASLDTALRSKARTAHTTGLAYDRRHWAILREGLARGL